MKDLFSPEFLKIISIWSLIPSYLVAGGAIGWAPTMLAVTG